MRQPVNLEERGEEIRLGLFNYYIQRTTNPVFVREPCVKESATVVAGHSSIPIHQFSRRTCLAEHTRRDIPTLRVFEFVFENRDAVLAMKLGVVRVQGRSAATGVDRRRVIVRCCTRVWPRTRCWAMSGMRCPEEGQAGPTLESSVSFYIATPVPFAQSSPGGAHRADVGISFPYLCTH